MCNVAIHLAVLAIIKSKHKDCNFIETESKKITLEICIFSDTYVTTFSAVMKQ